MIVVGCVIKVSEVQLFGDEDIQEDLYLAVNQWPTVHDRVLVLGSRLTLSQCTAYCIEFR